MTSEDIGQLLKEYTDLKNENRELRETLDAIRSGEVDAIVVAKGDQQKIYTLENADLPYQMLIEHIQEGAITLSLDSTILFSNTSFASMVHQPLAKVLGSSFADHFTPKDRTKIRELIRNAAHSPAKGQFNLCEDTMATPVQVSASPLDKPGDGRIGVVVTSRSEDEDRLRMQGRMLDSVDDAVITTDPDGKIIYLNVAGRTMLGWKPAEVIGRDLFEVTAPEGTDPSDTRNLMIGFREFEPGTREFTVHRRDGRSIPVFASKSPIFDAQGNPTAIVCALHDLSDQKRTESFLREYATNLKRSNEDLERFAYVASHDLKEPLRMVILFSQLLEQNYKGKLGADADEYIGYIVEGGKRMGDLVNDLLDYARVTSKGKDFEPTDMNEAVQQALSNLSVSIQESAARIETGALPKIMADRSQMNLVFQNLLSNAIKFRKGPCPSIAIGATRQGKDWVFSVRDDGIGIDPEFRERIFEIFQRLHARTEYTGTGVGLAICKRIVERHSGRIWVESELGSGSTFFFTIPDEKSMEPGITTSIT
jgi:PAS domain S-box-containing protein